MNEADAERMCWWLWANVCVDEPIQPEDLVNAWAATVGNDQKMWPDPEPGQPTMDLLE